MTATIIAILINTHILCVFSEDYDQSRSSHKMSSILKFYEDCDIDHSFKKMSRFLIITKTAIMINVLTKKCAYDDWDHERSPHKYTHFVCFLRTAFMILVAVLSKTHLVCVLY